MQLNYMIHVLMKFDATYARIRGWFRKVHVMLKFSKVSHDFCLCWILRPSQPIRVMSSAVKLPDHTFSWAGIVLKVVNQHLCTIFHQKDNCPFFNQRKGENDRRKYFDQSTTQCCRTRRGTNPRPPVHHSDWDNEASLSRGNLVLWKVTRMVGYMHARKK